MNYNPRWDIDRTYGEQGENLVGKILRAKIEVKRERKAAFTGNLAVEYRCRGKSSGISITTSKWWVYVWDDSEGYPSSVLFLDTKTFKLFIKKHWDEFRKVSGGDKEPRFPHGVSRLILVPLSTISQYLREQKDFE